MAGIQHLYDLYEKDPKFVEKILDSEVEVEEKLCGSRFSFEKKEGNELKFYKRNDSSPITKIDRTLAKYYEKAISHFESFTDEKLSNITEDWRFGFEYFPNLTPVKITYDRIPLNHLVLTDITVRDPNGKILKVLTDKHTLDEWASILEVEGPPIIFSGKLGPDQKTKILDFLHTGAENLEKRFKTVSFGEFFLKILNPNVAKSFMQNSLDKDIEALVFKFDGKNPLKIMNPAYTLEKDEKKGDEKPSDTYSLTLVLLQEFFQSLEFKKIKLKENTFEERYIEFISKAFVLFCKSHIYRNNFQGEIDFELPKFLTREEAKINFKFVKNPETMELLHTSSTNRELFKIIMASMRAHKKKPFGFFKKELIWYHNQTVDKIADYVNSGIHESLLAFQEFREIFIVNENEVTWEEFGMTKLNEVGFPTYSEVKKPVPETLSYLKVLNDICGCDVQDKNLETSAIVLCDTSPYHEGVLAALKDMKEQHGCKSVLCMIGNPFADLTTFSEISRKFFEEQKDLLHTVLLVKIPTLASLESIVKNKNLEVKYVCAKKNHFDDYVAQTGNTSAMHIDGRDMLDSAKVMEYLRNGDIEKFKKIGLPITHHYYYKLKQDLAQQ